MAIKYISTLLNNYLLPLYQSQESGDGGDTKQMNATPRTLQHERSNIQVKPDDTVIITLHLHNSRMKSWHTLSITFLSLNIRQIDQQLDLCTCILVNKQFYAVAYPLLWREPVLSSDLTQLQRMIDYLHLDRETGDGYDKISRLDRVETLDLRTFRPYHGNRQQTQQDSGVPCWPRLQVLNLNCCDDIDDATFICFINTHPHLQELRLEGANLTNASLDAMAVSLRGCLRKVWFIRVHGISAGGVRRWIQTAKGWCSSCFDTVIKS
ncbi:hypothetical protein BCR42DRAFT_495998 [Absidia repens]|uniref:F-box domain-containing protein n=1 Tax=Absidia repens TaxID=90262 RepID=A0A1X2I1V1_9FUNG|nr:hypothetical protein BCR42DRAFT_495998 [Absidia repens]